VVSTNQHAFTCQPSYTFSMLRYRPFVLFLAVFALLGTGCTSPELAADVAWQGDLATWRAQHAVELQKSDGWLSLVGLEWLSLGDNSFGAAADNKIHLPGGGPEHLGILDLEGTKVTLAPPPGGFPAGFLVDGKPAQQQELHTDPNSDKHNPRMTIGTLNVYVVRRGDRFALRIKDAKAQTLVGFRGLRWYPPDPAYRVTATWIPYNPPKSVTLATLIGTSYPQPVPGVAEFRLSGATYQLEPVLEDPSVPKLFFILRDVTSTSTTYGACRFLYTRFPSNGLDKAGQLVLDFNRLENPPCAYTSFATCPLPPSQNRLSIALPVGEQRYHD
jgi:uncharacterized protein